MTETSIKYWPRGRSKSWEKLNQEFEEGSAVLFNCQVFFFYLLQAIGSLVKPRCEKKNKTKGNEKHPAKGCKELFLVSFIPGWSKMNQRIQSLHREQHRAILAAVKSGLVLDFIGKDRVKRVRKRRPLRVFNSLADTANTLSSPNTTDSPALLNSWEEIIPREEKRSAAAQTWKKDVSCFPAACSVSQCRGSLTNHRFVQFSWVLNLSEKPKPVSGASWQRFRLSRKLQRETKDNQEVSLSSVGVGI